MSPGPVIGVDAGGTKLLAGVVHADLTVGHRVRRLWSGGDRAEVLDTMVEAVSEAHAAAPEVTAVGFGIPALLDFEAGIAVSSVHLPLEDLAFRELMEERLGLPVYVDNDANLAALAAQRVGAARGTRNVVMLTLGTGIGSGIVIDGRVFRGATGAGAEIGHMTIDEHGPPCQGTCPGRGCLEVMASGTAIGREGTDAGRRHPDSALGRAVAQRGLLMGEEVTQLALGGDEAACSVMAAAGRSLGAGLASVVNIFEPEVVVVGGGASAAGDLLLDPAREVVAQRALRPSRDHVRIVPAAFAEEAGMIGAALFALADGVV
ncbi:MAG: glucokinase [Thermoleophilaceae bacterium]|nr:glucokinase [Thermoleophilaceae bacterium]